MSMPDVNTFCPFTTKCSPLRTARVVMEAASEPACGSVSPKQKESSPRSDARQQRSLLLGRAMGRDRIAAVRERAEHPHAELFEMPADLFEHDREIDRRAAGAAVFGRDDDAEPAVLRQGFVGLARRPAFVVAAFGILRRAHFIQQIANVFAQTLLLGREIEIHRQLSSFAISSTLFARLYIA